MKQVVLFSLLFLLGAGCVASDLSDRAQDTSDSIFDAVENTLNHLDAPVQLPVDEYVARRTQKGFGEYIEDRFTGYHVGDDIEFTDTEEEVPVYAIADGVVRYVDTVGGYGGLIMIEHDIGERPIMALYGHVDVSSAAVTVGDEVSKGLTIAHLGNHETAETDFERKHLHFALYEGTDIRLQGYETLETNVANWINPQTFFEEQGLNMTTPARVYGQDVSEAGNDVFPIVFAVPPGMEVEYVPSIQSLNVYLLSGEGTARDRSQLFIRYFDASDFLTLSTVTIHSIEDLTVGVENDTARRYDIEKNTNVTAFLDQPDWRNNRHIVTDVRAEDGYTRYYVIAANPDLSQEVYEAVLASLEIK